MNIQSPFRHNILLDKHGAEELNRAACKGVEDLTA